MASKENANIPFPGCQDQFLEFLADESIPVPEYVTGIHTKPKKNYLRKGTGLLRYRIKPKQNTSKQILESSKIPNDKSDRKFLPDINKSEDGIKAKRALKRPHDDWESYIDNPSNLSILNDSVAEKQELLIFERLEKETANCSMCSSHESECSEKHCPGQLDCSSNVSDCSLEFPVYQMYNVPIEPMENATKCEILSNQPGDVANADKEIREILEALHITNNTVSHDKCQTPENYNDQEAWRKLMEMTREIYNTSIGITTSLSQPSNWNADINPPSCTPKNDDKSVSSQCSQSKQETGVQVSDESNPSYNELQEKLEKIEAEIHMYKTKCTDLNKQIKVGDAEKEKLKKELDRLVLTESQLKRKVQEIGQRKVKLNHLHENDKKLVNKKVEECLILKKQIQNIKDNLIEKENLYKALENKNKKLVEVVSSLKKRIEYMKQQISVKSYNKADKTTSTRDMYKLNKELREQNLIDALTIRDVVPKKSIPNYLMHSVGTQVFLENDEICPMECNVTKGDEQFNDATLQTEQGNSRINPVKNCADGNSRINPVKNCADGNSRINPVKNCADGNSRINPVKNCADGNTRINPVKNCADGNSRINPVKSCAGGNSRINPVKSCAGGNSRIRTVTNHTKGNLNISPVVISSPDKSRIDPVIISTLDDIKDEKSDVDANSVNNKESCNFAESVPTLAKKFQEESSSENSYTCKKGKNNKFKVKDKQFLNNLISCCKEMSDGRKVTVFLNGTKKFSSADGKQVKVLYVNGDILKKDYVSRTESYYFSSHNSWQTKHCDGRKTLEFPNGQTETYYRNGTKVIELSDGTEFTLFKSGIMKWVLPDGTTHLHTVDGKRLSLFKNGQKELHLKMITVRQYPDGTASVRYPNGTVETRYWNGRRRVKNKFGVLISDTGLI